MPFLSVFHPESAPVSLGDNLHYVVYSALQWNDANLRIDDHRGRWLADHILH
jgi:hypothetical protein